MAKLETLAWEVDPTTADRCSDYIGNIGQLCIEQGVVFDRTRNPGSQPIDVETISTMTHEYTGTKLTNFELANIILGSVFGSAKIEDSSIQTLTDITSVDLEVLFRSHGYLDLGQTVRQHPALLARDARLRRVSRAQIGLALSTYDPASSGQYAKDLLRIAKASPPPTEVLFIERFDGKYPISDNPSSHGKLSSLHIATNLEQMGIQSSILAYIHGDSEYVLTDSGVYIHDTKYVDQPDKSIGEDQIVFVTGWTSGYERLRLRGIPSSLVMRAILQDTMTEKRLARISQAKKSCVFVSEESKEQVGINPEANVIPNGYDEQIFSYRPREIENKVVFAGALVEEKGIDYFIELARRNPDYQFVIAGSAKMYGTDREQVVQPLLPNVIFLGEIQQADLAEVFRSSLASIFLTDPKQIFETFGKSAMESTLCGCPLIYVENGGLKSTVVEHPLSIAIPALNVDQIQRALAEIENAARNPKKRKNLADKAVKKHVTWKVVAGKFLARGLESVIESDETRRHRTN